MGSKTRTLHTSLNGFQTISNHQSVISHQRVLRCQSLSSETPPLSKRCSRELPNNSQQCSEERLSYIGTLPKVWTRWNSLKPNQTWTIWSLSPNNTKKPPPKTRT